MLEIGRKEDGMGSNESLNMMCFYADNIDIGSCREFATVSHIMERIKQACSENSFYFRMFSVMVQISSIDNLVDIMNSARHYFSVPVSINPNGVSAPFMMRHDSLIGLYMRRVLVKWEVLSYSEISYLYAQYRQHFLVAADRHTNTSDSTPVTPFRAVSIPLPMEIAQTAMLSGDIYPALESIHTYCDQSSYDPLRQQTDALAGGIDALNSLMKGSPDPKSRHQQAMLSLANMWVRGGYFGQASVATEEGMKMAHQLGDHVSVARALLLLFYVVEGMTNGDHRGAADDSYLSAEEVLIRCLQRCVELDMRQLEIQATLLLVRLRSRWPLYACVTAQLGFVVGSYDSHMLGADRIGSLDTEPSRQLSHVAPHSLWTLLCSTQLDESLQQVKGQLSAHHSQSQKPAPSHPKQKKATEAMLLDGPCTSRRMTTIAHAALVACDLWVRLGVHAMAALTLRRALRQVSVFVEGDLVVHLLLRLADVLGASSSNGAALGIAHCLLSGEGGYAVTAAPSSSSTFEHIIRTCQSLQTSCDLSMSIRRLIRYTHMAGQIRQVLMHNLRSGCSEGVMRKAARDCSVLCEIVGDPVYHPLDYTFNARIMQCAVNSYLDSDRALIDAREIYADADRSGCSYWKGEAMILMAALCLRSDSQPDIPTAIYCMQSLIDLDRAEYIPSVATALVVLISRLSSAIQSATT